MAVRIRFIGSDLLYLRIQRQQLRFEGEGGFAAEARKDVQREGIGETLLRDRLIDWNDDGLVTLRIEGSEAGTATVTMPSQMPPVGLAEVCWAEAVATRSVRSHWSGGRSVVILMGRMIAYQNKCSLSIFRRLCEAEIASCG
jgi:hypothetical protein